MSHCGYARFSRETKLCGVVAQSPDPKAMTLNGVQIRADSCRASPTLPGIRRMRAWALTTQHHGQRFVPSRCHSQTAAHLHTIIVQYTTTALRSGATYPGFILASRPHMQRLAVSLRFCIASTATLTPPATHSECHAPAKLDPVHAASEIAMVGCQTCSAHVLAHQPLCFRRLLRLLDGKQIDCDTAARPPDASGPGFWASMNRVSDVLALDRDRVARHGPVVLMSSFLRG